MGKATKTRGSMGYGKPSQVDKGVAGKSVDGIPMGEQQTYKQTGNIVGMKPHGNENHTGGNYSHGSHKGNPY